MSLIDRVEGAVVDGLVRELAELPAKAFELISDLVKGAKASDDPQRYIERRLIADGAHAVAQSTLDAALEADADEEPPTTIVNGFPKGE